MSNRFTAIAKAASQKTNQDLATELTNLLPVSEDKLKKMVPTKLEKEQLAELMLLVHGATSHNKKVAALTKNIDKLAGVAIKAIGGLT